MIMVIVTLATQMSYWGLQKTSYVVIKNVNYVFIALLILLNFTEIFKALRQSNYLLGLSILCVVQLILLIIIYGIGADMNLNTSIDILVVLTLLAVSYSIKLDIKRFDLLILIFLVLNVISALSVVYFFAPDLVINEYYLPVPKNQIAPIYGVGVMLGLNLLLRKNGIKKIFPLIFILIFFICILIVRGRSVIVATILSLILYFIFFIKDRRTKIFFVFFSIIFLMFFWNYIYESFTLNYDVTDVESLSSGRASTYEESIAFIRNNLLLGEIGYGKFADYTTHNYILNILVNYGILFSLPSLIIYFMLIYKLIKGLVEKNRQIFDVSILLIYLLIIVSMFEYSYPYSPGSATLFPFILFGQYLRQIDLKRKWEEAFYLLYH